mgnify:CR=1 FL=1
MLHNKKAWNDGLPNEQWDDEEYDAMARGVCLGGGKGGGGGGQAPPTTSTVNQSNLPDYAEPFFTRLLERTEEESNAPYQEYGGQRISNFGEDTEAGFQGIRDTAQAGTPDTFTTAENTLSGIANQGPLDEQSQFGGVQQFNEEGVAQSYMDPYIDSVISNQQHRLGQRFGEDQLLREANAVKQGAFSNDRRDVVDSIAQRELNIQKNEIQAAGLSDAYQQGSQIFNQGRAADLQNRSLNTQVFSGNQERAIAQNQMLSGIGGQLREQGLAGDQLALNRAKNLAGVGGATDARAQQGLDVGYTDFINQRDFPRQQLNYYSGILRGVPISAQQETTTYQAPPNELSQLLGLGIGGLGLAKALG